MIGKAVFILCWMLCLAIVTPAQTTGGRIIDLSGNGVPLVEIRGSVTCVGPLGPGFFAVASTSVFSDSEGRFLWPEGSLNSLARCTGQFSYSYQISKENYIFTKTSFTYIPEDLGAIPKQDDRWPVIQATNLPAIRSVSAASFSIAVNLAEEMILAGFGAGMSEETESAQLPLPTLLAGRSLLFKDQNGVEKPARLLYASPSQINYITPSGLAQGPLVIRLVDQNGALIRTGLGELTTAAPGVFTANANGGGAPAGILARVRPGDLQSFETVFEFDAASQSFLPRPIDLGPEDEFLVLTLFGTGWRRYSIGDVDVHIGKGNAFLKCPVEYVGPQPGFDGVDQVNVRLPRDLRGIGEAILHMEFKNPVRSSNRVVLNIK